MDQLIKIQRNIRKIMSPEQKKESDKRRRSYKKAWDKQQKEFTESIGKWFKYFNSRYTVVGEAKGIKIFVERDQKYIFEYVATALRIGYSFEAETTHMEIDGYIVSLPYADLINYWNWMDSRTWLNKPM